MVVYTALFGPYDNLIEPKRDYDYCDFICFTDQKHINSDIWKIRLIDQYELPPNMMNRKIKILPHNYLSDYEWSLYVDANIEITGNPFSLARKYLTKYDFVLPKHFERDCIYEEARECIILGRANKEVVKRQINNYKMNGFPKRFGMGENNILLRNHNEKNISSIMNSWWTEINTYTQRDQLSLAYVLWKTGEKFHFMEESARNGSKYFRYWHHKQSKNRNLMGRIRDKAKIVVRRIIY